MSMAASFSFELLKLRKRPATWVLAVIMVLFVFFFDYFQFYSAITALEEGGQDPTGQITDVEEFKNYLLPASVTVNVAGLLSFFGGPFALIIGALSAGSEYGWGTLKTSLTQRPGRLSILAGKFLAVGVAVAGLSVLALGAGAVSSYVVAGLFEGPVDWPGFGNVLKGLGIIWLILGAWASLGVFLALIFRGTALAIGLGLIYGLVIESLIFGFSETSRIIEALTYVLLGRNGGDLANSLGDAPRAFTSPEAVDPAQAALVLAGYVVLLLITAALVFRWRDVT
jgi:ABC-type transport system involved in multi-copper enzyme maturation permease subunit